MKRLITTLLFIASVAALAFGQGPHTPVSPITKAIASFDGKRILTASWGDVAVWNMDDYSVIRSFEYKVVGLPLTDSYYIVGDPKLNTIWIRAGSTPKSAVIDIDKWEFYNTSGFEITHITADLRGVYKEGDKEKLVILRNLATGETQAIKNFVEDSWVDMSPDGTKLSTRVGKYDKGKSKTYDIATGKLMPGRFDDPAYRTPGKVSYNVWVSDNTFTINPGANSKTFNLKYGGTFGAKAELVWADADRVIVWENKNDRSLSKYENFAVVYSSTTGEVIKEIPLNRSQEEAKKIREAEEEAQKKRQAEADAARQEKMANAKPGYKKFDASFRDLSLPYTMDYNAAQGFSLAGDAFIYSDMMLRSGSEIFGMGRICSCNDNSTYLLMVRNKTGSTDLSNFILVSYDIGGNQVGSRTIGATQKDPSGLTRLDFTINKAYCGATVKATTTYSNGNKQDGSFSFGGCKVN